MTTGKLLRAWIMVGVAGAAGCAPAPADIVVAPQAVSTPPSASAPAKPAESVSVPAKPAESVAVPAPTAKPAVTPAPTAAPASPPMKPGASTGMVLLPGGTYTTRGYVKTVTLTPFWLDVTEVTVGAYKACVLAKKCTEDGLLCEDIHTYGVPGKEKYPLNCVDHSQATAYCAYLGKRLPTGAELEWAGRGTTKGSKYPWGEQEPSKQLCWYRLDFTTAKGQGPCAVHSFPAGDTPQGIADLAGNLDEWTAIANPTGVPLHGGHWKERIVENVEPGVHGGPRPNFHSDEVGFRCAGTAEGPAAPR
jgi:formylglycine-generating enzyme required for sulfatase activity